MKALVVSDVHRDAQPLRIILEALQKPVKTMQMAFFLGDGHELAVPVLEKWVPVTHAVQGNCDERYNESEKLVSVEGQRVLLAHGHKQQVKFGYQRMVYTAREKEAQICLFGHTHQAAVFYEQGILFMNPGSIGNPRWSALPSFGILEWDSQGVHPTLLGLDGEKIVPLPPQG